MNFLSRQTIASPEASNGCDHLILQSSASIEICFRAGKPDEEISDERTHRRFLFGSFDPSLPVDVIR
jgi:hypothetical protein